MYDSILVPVDGSPVSEQAVPMAAAIAERAGARLDIVTVRLPGSPPYLLTDTPPLDTPPERERRVPLDNYVERIAAGVRERVPEATATVLEGEIAQSLVKYAEDRRSSLVAMTTHGRGGISRMWIGSVSERLIREIGTPVLLRRPSEAPSAEAFRIERMLVPLDESPVSEAIVEPAGSLAAAFGAQVTLLRVLEPVITRARIVTAPATEIDEEDLQQQAAAAARYLAGIMARLGGSGVRAEPLMTAHHQPARAILDSVKTSNADVVAMATHGYGGLRRIMIGSVTDKVLRGAECPVLVYRPAS